MNTGSVARLRSCACSLAIVLIATSARAEPSADSRPTGEVAQTEAEDDGEVTSEPGAGRRSLAVAASLIPGLAWHGAGHHVLGESKTGKTLGTIELVGLGMAVVGGGYLVATGASRYLAGPTITMVVAGMGLFTQSWLADLYGTTGAAHLGGRAGDERADLIASLGYAYVEDPQFSYSQFARAQVQLTLGGYHIRPVADIAMDADNQRGRIDVARPVLEERTEGDGSRVEIHGAVTHHRYGEERFSTSTVELALMGRLDLARLGQTTRGSFADMRVGLAGELIDYRNASFDLSQLLLVRFGYGVYLGRGRGELSVFYDHRRDTLAGGISPGPGPGSGFLGFMGVSGIYWLTEQWGLAGDFEQGSARIGRLLVTRRLGGVR